MPRSRIFAVTVVALGIVALAHATFTWPLYATVSFFGVGAIVAFIAEAVVINLGWLEHHVGLKVIGVPLYVLFGWTGTIYVVFRVSLLVTDGWSAVILAGVLATTYDVLTDHLGVADGYWTYTDDLPGPRYRGVPWWNSSAGSPLAASRAPQPSPSCNCFRVALCEPADIVGYTVGD